jgi:hypothetical protein
MEKPTGFEKCFRRDAPLIKAKTAQGFFFDEGDLGTPPDSVGCRRFSPRPSTNDEQ